MASYSWPPEDDGSSGEVTSINGLTGDITLAAGVGISIGSVGNTITITNTGAVNSIGPLDSQPANANGLALVAGVLSTQSATTSFPGMVNNTTQSFSGNKTFTGTITASNFSGSSSGTNTGDITLTPVGSSPNANGASLSGQALTLQPADSTFPGLVSVVVQSFKGIKTFTDGLDAGSDLITSVLDPVSLQDAATKNYTDMYGGTRVFTSAGGTTTLTAADLRDTAIAGTLTQTFVLPSTATLQIGNWWRFINRSTGIVTIQRSDLTTLVTVQSQTASFVRVTSTATQVWAFYSFPIFSQVDGSVNFAGGKLINLGGPPTAATDGANKSYVDGTNVTLAAVGSSPNANGASLSGQVITLQPASISFPGVVTAIAQTFNGDKTFNNSVLVNGAVTATNALLIVKDGHYKSTQVTAPTISPDAAAGTGATASLANATDTAGQITINTGTVGLSTGSYAVITFNKTYNVAPIVVITPAGSTLSTSVYVTSTTTTFSINFALAGGISSTYILNYHTIETQ